MKFDPLLRKDKLSVMENTPFCIEKLQWFDWSVF